MKRTLLTLFCTLLALAASADEGMWLPSLISQRIDDMRAKGFRLTAEDIYSINKASMKDAVVLFNGGCTGELISSEGMLLTNHHCGYDAIQAHSSVEHDYLTNGFWAMSRREELPNKELNVRFLVRMEEVTDRIAAGETKAEIIRRAEAESKGYKASVEQMYYGNQQFLFIYEQFDDVRLVGAPPSSIGKFGGDTDNWIWPRHTGDFSLFRIYAGKDNKPAAYSPENVPYRPKRHFTISTAGVEEGDFTMIYGFPGNTQEYILSDAVAYIAERSDPAKIAIRTGRLDIISAAQESDPALRIHYAAKHASIANAWKKWQGEALGIGRLGTVASKRAYEQEFAAWAQDKPEYRSVVADLKAEYARIADAYFAREITRETLGALPERYTPEERAEAAFARREQTERALFEWLFGQYARRCPVQYQIPAFLAGVAASGSPEAYAGEVFDTLWREGADTTAVHALHKDTERMLGHIGWMLETKSLRNLNSGRLNELYTTYIKGLREWDTLRAFYPDANLTLRGLDGFTVKLIGEKTNGKNVGMEVSKFTVGNYSYELAPISFQGYNAKQVTVDKNGLAVDTACEEWDGELKDYGDRSEPMLAAALSQITGQRSASVSGTRSTAPGVRPATDIALPDLSNRPNGMIVFLPAAEE